MILCLIFFLCRSHLHSELHRIGLHARLRSQNLVLQKHILKKNIIYQNIRIKILFRLECIKREFLFVLLTDHAHMVFPTIHVYGFLLSVIYVRCFPSHSSCVIFWRIPSDRIHPIICWIFAIGMWSAILYIADDFFFTNKPEEIYRTWCDRDRTSNKWFSDSR